jgi:hypothetical protein
MHNADYSGLSPRAIRCHPFGVFLRMMHNADYSGLTPRAIRFHPFGVFLRMIDYAAHRAPNGAAS